MIFNYLKSIPIQELAAYCDRETFKFLLRMCQYLNIANFAEFCCSKNYFNMCSQFDDIASKMVLKSVSDTQNLRINAKNRLWEKIY